ncbi:uracil-DNA glycosylase family protein [Halomicroarcula sp. GCM10025709]|uniref:uracil-DNA glycosylase family protein n=1 Tax=Haloarcula TaxID=2237 RepID=UPI0024C255FF|nr:uracil-DNA glycosylase family protein [Halomicroarcula sp. YJ-61-S]
MPRPGKIEEIYSSWNPQDGGFQEHCKDCPIRDERGCRSPFFGSGTFDQNGEVDVMLIGESPGTASQNDGPFGGHSNKKDFDKSWENNIASSFNGNSPHLHPFTEALQQKYDVYYTNLLKCNKLATPNKGDSWLPAKIIDEQEGDISSVSQLNKVGKQQCENYLISELIRLQPSAIVPFGGEKMVSEVYDLLGMSVPKLKSSINARKVFDIEFDDNQISGVYSGKLIPSYHFSENRFLNRIRHVDAVESESVTEAREEYWSVILEMVEKAV